MKSRVFVLLASFGATAVGVSQATIAQDAPISEAYNVGRPQREVVRGSAVDVLRSQGFNVTGLKSTGIRKMAPASVTGTAVSTRTAIVNEWVRYTGLTSNLGTAESPSYPGSTDVCVRLARFDSPVSFNPTWRAPLPSFQDGVIEAYRIDTGQLFGTRTLDVEMTGSFTIDGGSPGLACANDGCTTTYTLNGPDIMAVLCEIWAGTDGTNFSRVGYCNQTDILPSIWNQGLRSKDDTLPPFDGGASTGTFRSRNTVNAGLGTYYRFRVGYFTIGANTANGSRVCDSLLSVTHD